MADAIVGWLIFICLLFICWGQSQMNHWLCYNRHVRGISFGNLNQPQSLELTKWFIHNSEFIYFLFHEEQMCSIQAVTLATTADFLSQMWHWTWLRCVVEEQPTLLGQLNSDNSTETAKGLKALKLASYPKFPKTHVQVRCFWWYWSVSNAGLTPGTWHILYVACAFELQRHGCMLLPTPTTFLLWPSSCLHHSF